MLNRMLIEALAMQEDSDDDYNQQGSRPIHSTLQFIQRIANLSEYILSQAEEVQPSHNPDIGQAQLLQINGSALDGLQDKLCAVCLEEISEEQPIYMIESCSHAFHRPCLEEWYKQKNECPKCREQF